MIRQANLEDLDELERIEARCFDTDRLSRRSFRHFLTRGHGILLVDDRRGRLAGYALVLFHRGTSLARLYSFAVGPGFRGRGVGMALLKAAEEAARDSDCVVMRLETRNDNQRAQALFRKAGYKTFGTYADYYDDHMDAIRMEKRLVKMPRRGLLRVPYYRQSQNFTCGPAALMMAMRGLNPGIKIDRTSELQIWREATTIFMQAGHGGCGPYGLALAAYRRGFDAEIFVNHLGALFVDSVQRADKKDAIRRLQDADLAEIKTVGIPLRHSAVTAEKMVAELSAGGLPVVLVSTYRLDRSRVPHWVVLIGADERFVYIHDPFVDEEKERTQTDSMGVPISRHDFDRMARFGKARVQAAVIIFAREKAE